MKTSKLIKLLKEIKFSSNDEQFKGFKKVFRLNNKFYCFLIVKRENQQDVLCCKLYYKIASNSETSLYTLDINQPSLTLPLDDPNKSIDDYIVLYFKKIGFYNNRVVYFFSNIKKKISWKIKQFNNRYFNKYYINPKSSTGKALIKDITKISEIKTISF